jgi:hypothetical protein
MLGHCWVYSRPPTFQPDGWGLESDFLKADPLIKAMFHVSNAVILSLIETEILKTKIKALLQTGVSLKKIGNMTREEINKAFADVKERSE